jgi:hypothetical protein
VSCFAASLEGAASLYPWANAINNLLKALLGNSGSGDQFCLLEAPCKLRGEPHVKDAKNLIRLWKFRR